MTKLNKTKNVTYIVILVTIIWGTTFPLLKVMLVSIDSFLLVLIRIIIASIAFSIFILIAKLKIKFNKKTLLHGIILGGLLATTFASQSYGLMFTTGGHSALIIGAAVVLVPGLQFFIFREHVIAKTWFAAIIVFIGLFLLTFDFKTGINLGDYISLISLVSYAFHILLAGKYVNSQNQFVLIMTQFWSATIFSLIFYLLWGEQLLVLNTIVISGIIYLSFFATLLAYFVLVWARKTIPADKLALLFTLEPVFALFFGYIFIGETINYLEFLAVLIILTGMVYSLTNRKFFLKIFPVYKNIR
ncbi:MAG: hypothetical protein DRI95_14160 [Bacteroidetes bacterium]|nr:MAG: hypothetical protein DRI95_14160 [Bacteroidota bacterium]